MAFPPIFTLRSGLRACCTYVAGALSCTIERATDELYCDAYTHVREHRRYGRRNLASLRHLDRQARAFRAQLERGSLHDRRTQREFRRLEHAYRDATRRVPDRLARRHLDDELARVERLIDRIDRRLEVSLARARDHRDDRRRGDRFAYRRHDDRFRITWSFGY